MKKTQIICSIGPASNDVEILKKMIDNGMNIARFNMSHGTYESHTELITNVKTASKAKKKKVAIMIDTKGPEIRIKKFENGQIFLNDGDVFVLTTNDVVGNQNMVSVSYKNLPKVVKKGTKILADDGKIELRVEKTNKTDILCTVVDGGPLKDRKSLNLPDTDTKMEFLSEQDKSDLLFAKAMCADYISLSFVNTPEDVKTTRKYLDSIGLENAKIIAKIESAAGVKNFDKILKVTDGIMVARGDLAVEIDYVKIPYLQKEFIKKCNQANKPVVVATQMLASMTEEPRPTRAEISDVANAVYDGTDMIMLSEETTSGHFPAESVHAMRRIADEAEKNKKRL